MADEVTLNIFVSSPGDVQQERERVDFVVARLNAEYVGRVRLQTVRWEKSYYSSHDTFQAQIPEAAMCDLVVAVFGARLGSVLPETFPPMPSGERYPSGSAYEVLSAMEARRKGRGVPDIYVFRRPTAPLVGLDATNREEIETQWRALTKFFENWFRNRSGEFLAAFQEFSSTDEFAGKIEDCLRQWLTHRGFPPKVANWDRRLLGSPYPGLTAFDETRQSVFFGRSILIEQALRRLREGEAPAHDGERFPFLLLIGASGSGKSSLLRAGLMPKVALPGILPEVDLWRRVVTMPGLDPFDNFAESLLAPEALGPELSDGPFRSRELLSKQLSADPDVAVAVLRAALDAAAEKRRAAAGFSTLRPARLFLAIDQAERLLVETPPEAMAPVRHADREPLPAAHRDRRDRVAQRRLSAISSGRRVRGTSCRRRHAGRRARDLQRTGGDGDPTRRALRSPVGVRAARRSFACKRAGRRRSGRRRAAIVADDVGAAERGGGEARRWRASFRRLRRVGRRGQPHGQ